MSLSAELQQYLHTRRNLGYDLSTSERVLKRFVSFLEENNETHITVDLFLQWKQVFGKAKQDTWGRRLSIVRQFAAWLHSLDSRHEVPAQSLIPVRYRRKSPYIYTDDEIRDVLDAAALLPSKNGLRELTYPAFFGLIAVTGLRISEAISLNNQDVDLKTGVITLHDGKNYNGRILPLTKCTAAYLQEYARKRDRLLGRKPESFFVSDEGIRLTDCAVRYNFATVCQTAGLRSRQRYHKHGVGPRIHDLRHTFAVKVMINWYKAGEDVDQEMLKLVTYLGHKSIAHTYWYIEAVPELLALASQRAEKAILKEVQS